MIVERIRKRERLYDGGNEVLLYRVEIPRFEGAEEINSFYSLISDGCEEYCKSILFDKLRAQNERKIYSYKMQCRVTYFDEAVASVVIFACLCMGKEILSQYIGAHTWEIESGSLLPPEYVSRRVKGIKRTKRKAAEGIFIDGGELKNIRDVDIEDLLARYGDK